MYDLREKIVLITGGGRGIGFNCAKEVLQAGARAVTVAEISEALGEIAVKELITQFGPNKALFVKTDVTDADSFETAFRKTINTWKCVDVLINNAGILNDAEWELEIATNATAVTQGTLLGFKHMGKENGGRGGVIINIASTLGLQPNALCPVYGATKSFVIGMSRSLGALYHYNRTGVKVCVMCPGGTDTQLEYHALLPSMQRDIIENLRRNVKHHVDYVGRGIVSVITKGDNGSVWVSENNEDIYEVNVPDRKTLRK